jgi:hypothetical protein
MGFFSKLFGKPKKVKSERNLAAAFHATKIDEYDYDVLNKEIRSDLAFQEPAYKRLKELESKIQVSPEDFMDISFEMDVDNISFGTLSDAAKKQILEIVRKDRINKLGEK